MAVTSLKEVNYRVKIVAPQATELQKLENKSTISYIYVGKPLPEFVKTYGTETQIQLNDAFASVSQLQDYVVRERSAMKAQDQSLMTISIRADKDTHMGIITEIKQALRRANALKISYAAQKRIAD
jgi:biopolymer transport protein ExbD